ncbi:peroxidase 2 [Lolium perenne]|uniref:peroxidase 2 n=1 Tax=Lolium perenne TaxID=4522 RepID=UPI0021EA16B2|nr:peroxidase 22.3-like [Lolium perenne]
MAKLNEKRSIFLVSAFVAVALLAAQVKPAMAATVYTTQMETCVRGIVEKPEKRIDLPGLVRLLFHDAFVRGLDGSVLLTSTPFNTTDFATKANLTEPTEQGSPSNGGLRGLGMIDEIREALEVLNVTASCADAVAFAAREATYVLSKTKIKYAIDGPGRLDGVVSMADEPGSNLPGPSFTYAQLLGNFTAKKFTATDLVALSGAHCIGDTHLLPFADRLNVALAVPPPGPNEINATYQGVIIREEAQSPGDMTRSFKNNIRDMGSTAVAESRYTPNKVDMTAPVDTLDNSFYNANLQNMVRFKSDWELRTNSFARGLMVTYRDNPDTFYAAFKAAMTKLSNNLPAVGTRFERGSRKICSATNFDTQESYPAKNKP